MHVWGFHFVSPTDLPPPDLQGPTHRSQPPSWAPAPRCGKPLPDVPRVSLWRGRSKELLPLFMEIPISVCLVVCVVFATTINVALHSCRLMVLHSLGQRVCTQEGSPVWVHSLSHTPSSSSCPQVFLSSRHNASAPGGGEIVATPSHGPLVTGQLLGAHLGTQRRKEG